LECLNCPKDLKCTRLARACNHVHVAAVKVEPPDERQDEQSKLFELLRQDKYNEPLTVSSDGVAEALDSETTTERSRL